MDLFKARTKLEGFFSILLVLALAGCASSPYERGGIRKNSVNEMWNGIIMEGGFKFQVQRVNDGAVAHRLPGAWQS